MLKLLSQTLLRGKSVRQISVTRMTSTQSSDSARHNVASTLIILSTLMGVVEARTSVDIAEAAGGEQTATLHDGMKLIFEDNFDGTALDTKRWYAGPKPDGGYWSDAEFVKQDEPHFKDTYKLSDGILSLRAVYDAAAQKWFGAEISSAFPDGHSTGSFRRGYTEARVKLPKGKGPWPGFWMLDLDSIDKSGGDKGAVEIDIFEGYGFPHNWNPNVINWTGSGSAGAKEVGNIEVGSDITAGFHTYGCLITETQVVWFFDGTEKYRKPLPKAGTVSPFYVIIDMAMGGGWPIEVPVNGYYEMQIDFVRIWSMP